MKPKLFKQTQLKNVSASIISSWPLFNTAGVLVLLADMQFQASWIYKSKSKGENGSYFILEIFCLTTGDIYMH